MPLTPPQRSVRWLLWAGGILLGLVLVVLLAFVSIDIGRWRGTAAAALSKRLGRPVTIGALAREGRFTLTPTIRIDDLVIAQPAWAPAGLPPMARVHTVRLRLPLLPALVGRVRPEAIELDRPDLMLFRGRDRQANWAGGKRSGGPTGFARLTIRQGHVRLDDRYRERTADLRLTAQPETGFRATGAIGVRGTPGTLDAFASVQGPFRATFAGPALSGTIAGRLGPAYNAGGFVAHADMKGRDLKDLDVLVEAGLPGTQPFALDADIEHQQRDWTIHKLSGTIGRSCFTGNATVQKDEGRTRLDGTIHAATLDFDDLATDAQKAAAAARQAAIGPRVVPPTRINLAKLRKTDAHFAITVDRLLWARPAPFTAIKATIALDRGTLTVAPLTVALTQGTLTGRATVRHPDGSPRLSLDLHARGARLQDIVGGTTVTGPLDARIRIDGTGETVREAVGNGRGRVALVTRGGSIDRRAAELLGRNVGRALRAEAGDRTRLNCLIAVFAGRNGRFAPAPLVLDTPVMRADGRGTLNLANERLALTLDGRSKVPAAFRLAGPITATGTLKRPNVIAPQATSTDGILKTIGRALGGEKEAAAVPANCPALASAALR